MNSWDKQDDETVRAYEAFTLYLKSPDRNLRKIADNLQKHPTLIRSWASKYSWAERATAFDSSLLEDVRQKIKREWTEVYMRRWQGNALLEKKSLDALLAKDMSKASFKSLNEIYHGTWQEQKELAAAMGLTDADTEDLTITIKAAEKHANSEGS